MSKFLINEKKINYLENEKITKINNLIEYIVSLKREKVKEKNNESAYIKLARRLEQRANKILSEEIAFHLIINYEINNNKLPSKEVLIQLMINFLGNIQKSQNNYKLIDNKKEIYLKVNELIGNGSHGNIYSYNLKTFKQTSKQKKLIKN